MVKAHAWVFAASGAFLKSAALCIHTVRQYFLQRPAGSLNSWIARLCRLAFKDWDSGLGQALELYPVCHAWFQTVSVICLTRAS